MSQKPYPIPPFPSPHLTVVLDYIEFLESFEFDGLSKLTTPYFTQQTLPASLDLPVRSKAEDLAYLETVKESVGGANLNIIIYDIVEGIDKIWVHVFINTIKVEAIYKFTFGAGLDNNFVIRCIEFVDSKAIPSISGSSIDCGSDGSSDGSSDYSSDGSSDA